MALGLFLTLFVAQAALGTAFAQTTSRWEHYWHSGPGGSWYVRPLSCHSCRDVSNNPVVCDDKHCYGREAVGFGLLPKRSYRVVYAQDMHVCNVIAGALNWALTRSDAELENAWAGVPDPIQVANPIFSSDVFLRWHHLMNYPPVSWHDGDLRHLWIIVRVLNDGIPRLITSRGTNEPSLWGYSTDELSKGTWDDFRIYDPSRKVSESENPIYAVMNYLPPRPPENWIGAPAVYRFPNLPKALWQSRTWTYSSRQYGDVTFANVDGRVYLVGQDGTYDTMYVADVSRRPGDDICYLDSTLSTALVKTMSVTSLPKVR